MSRHRELTQQALRDEATLVNFQNQLKQFELEQARDSNPWELISTPTLLDNPVSPRRKRTIAFGLLGGLVLGSGAALFSDRRSGRVFSSEELSRELPCPLLERLPCHGETRPLEAWHAPIQLLADGPRQRRFLRPNSSRVDWTYDLDAFSTSLSQALGPHRELLISVDLADRSQHPVAAHLPPVPPRESSCTCENIGPFKGHRWRVGCYSTPLSKTEPDHGASTRHRRCRLHRQPHLRCAAGGWA